MTRAEAVAAIQLQLAFRTTLDSSIILCLQLAQTQLEEGLTKPWFLVSEDSYIFTVVGEPRSPVPTDFLEETDEAVFRYVPTTPSADNPEVDLLKDDYDELRKSFMDQTTGIPQVGKPKAYALLGDYFRIFPTPDAIYRLRMIYYKEDLTLGTNIENGWLKHCPFALLGKAGKMIAGGPMRDTIAFGVFENWEKEGLARMLAQGTTRDSANKLLQVGGRH